MTPLSKQELRKQIQDYAVDFHNSFKPNYPAPDLDALMTSVDAYSKQREVEAQRALAQKIADKVRLEYEAGGRYPGHLIQPWEEIARPIIYGLLNGGHPQSSSPEQTEVEEELQQVYDIVHSGLSDVEEVRAVRLYVDYRLKQLRVPQPLSPEQKGKL